MSVNRQVACKPERALTYRCVSEHVVGVLSEPVSPADTGVVILVGGPQYRAGSHRQFVLLARSLAAAGFAVLRFDFRGMGDSEGAQRSFESLGDDVAAAVSALAAEVPLVKQVVLWGLCDGASASLLYVEGTTDPRVAGLALVNPWVRSEASLARAHVKHYYRQRLLQRGFWVKLLTGGVAAGALVSLWRNVRSTLAPSGRGSAAARTYQQRMADGCSKFCGPKLLMLSANDLTAQEFSGALATDPVWHSATAAGPIERVELQGADHTMSDPLSQRQMEDITAAWMVRSFGRPDL
jgi:exosortase A-associated hydrolase 1